MTASKHRIVDPTLHIDLTEGTRASVGDVVITRLNDRRLIEPSLVLCRWFAG